MKKLRKFKFIAGSEMHLEDIAKFHMPMYPPMARKAEKKYLHEKLDKILIPSDFVLALCGGTWPKSKDGANFSAVACWKIDLERKTLVPLDGSEGPDNECPVPDLKLQVAEY